MKKEETMISALTDLFLKINEKENVFSAEEILEFKDNVSRYKSRFEEMGSLLSESRELLDKENCLRERLVHVNQRMLDFIWHFEELDEMYVKLVKHYLKKEAKND